MIEFKHVNKSFYHNKPETKILKNINIAIEDNDIFGIIGYSGAGKSTLIRLINALEKPTSGKILIDGHDLANFNTHEIRQMKQKIGMIFQGFNLLESKTVAENISLPLLLAKVAKKERDKIVDKLLNFVDLKEKKFAYPSELSGGQKQRVCIARALANQPKILLCDEATSALDPQTTRAILDLLKRINQEQKVTIVLVTHEMSVVKHICNNMLVMEKGQIVEQGNVVDIFQNPASPVTRKFINAVIYDKLPTQILNNMLENDITNIYRFEFLGSSCRHSVLSDAILRDCGKISINILFSNMIDIKENVIGYMFVNIEGKPKDIKDAIEFLRNKQVRIAKLDKDGNYV